MSKRYWIFNAAIALAAGFGGVLVGRMLAQPQMPSLEAGTAMPPRPVGGFILTDAKGATTTARDLAGHPTLVFFGFTHCPDVCPTTLALLAGVQKQAAREEPRLANLRVALISVDPERDTPEQVGRYVASFGSDFIGLTGSPPEIVNATRSFNAAFARVELPGGAYTMDHSATVYVLDSGARIVAVFTPPLNAAALTRDVVRLSPVIGSGS
jgi:protein SCO1/2